MAETFAQRWRISGAAVPSVQPPQHSPTPAWGCTVPWCSLLPRGLGESQTSSLPAPALGQGLLTHWVVPPGSQYQLTPNPRVAASPEAFRRPTFPLAWRETEVWNLVSNTQVADTPY